MVLSPAHFLLGRSMPHGVVMMSSQCPGLEEVTEERMEYPSLTLMRKTKR